MRHATLRQLKAFEAVARHLSFSRAAEELHLTQPAVSIQIGKLVQHAGVPLLEQLGRKIYLTDAGEELLRSSRAIIELFHQAEESMSQFRGVSGGRLRVAVISAGDYFFPQLLVEFMRRHSGAILDFVVCNREELLARLVENQTDLAVMVRPPEGPDMVSDAFAPHPYVVVAAPGHPLVGKKRLSMARIAQEPFIAREVGSDTWQSMRQGFGQDMDRLQIALQIRSTETIKQAVMAGMGLSFLSAHTVNAELRAGSLSMLSVQGLPLMLNWYLVHRQNKRLTPVAQAFKAYLLKDGAALIKRTLREVATAPKRAAQRKRKRN